MYKTDQESRPNRYSIDELITITDLQSNKIIGNLLDIHKYGLGAILNIPVTIDQYIDIRLTSKINEQIQFIDINVQVCWCHEKCLANKYGAGFKINGIDIKAKLRIDNLINYYASKLSKSTEHEYSGNKEGGDISLTSQSSYTAKNIDE